MLKKKWLRADEKLTKRWWRAQKKTDEELMMSWWGADEELMKNWWTADEGLGWAVEDCLRLPLNYQSYLGILHNTILLNGTTPRAPLAVLKILSERIQLRIPTESYTLRSAPRLASTRSQGFNPSQLSIMENITPNLFHIRAFWDGVHHGFQFFSRVV